MRLAIISGVSRGLGAELMSQIFGIPDFEIFAISRSFDNVPSSERIIRKKSDLSSLTSCKDFFSSVEFEKYNDVFVFNNASSILPIGSIGDLSEDTIKSTINLNTIAPILLINEIMSHVRNNLTLINLSTGAAKRPIAGWGLYCATKAANAMFFNVIGLQEKNNSTFNLFTIDPGVMDTGMQKSIRRADENQFPDRKDFLRLKQDSLLKSPSIVATEILNEVGII